MLAGVIRYRCWPLRLQSVRLLATQADVQVTVDKALLSKLRKKTGYPMLNCKKALEQFNNDIKQAESWMREQAQKEGWAKAGKLQDRPMSQGLVGMIHDGTAVTIVEVNCETDFVARNENFQGLVNQLAEACHKSLSQRTEEKVMLDKTEVNALPDDGKTLADHVALQVGNLGENIALRRAAFMRADENTVMSTFVHAAGPSLSKDRCQLGKFAAVVKLEVPDYDNVAKLLCQHIVGMNPATVGEWDPLPVDKKEQKKKKKKEEEVIRTEPMLENNLLDQEFLMEPGCSVRDFLKKNGPRVVDFVRLECGEEFGEEE